MRIRFGFDDGLNDCMDNTYTDMDGCEIKGCGVPSCAGWSELIQKVDYKIIVWTDDPGQIPHFHVVDANTRGRKFDSCVRLDCAAYFKHGSHDDKLNSGDRKAVVKFLNLISPKDPCRRTNWQRVVFEWNRNNSTNSIPEDQVMPNYLTLKGPK